MAKDKAGKAALAKVRDFDLASIDSRIDTLEGAKHTHSNKSILDATTESFTTALKNIINSASPSTHDHNTVYYTKSEVDTKVASLVDSSPETLNTLNELAAALGDDPNFAATIAAQIGAKENAITAGTASQYFRGDKTWATMPTTLPASDVYTWAKASVKPSYVWSEIGSKPTTLSGYGITDASASSHTHNYAGSSSAGGSASSVANSCILKFDTGTTEGTNLYTFNGSTAKTIDIKAGTNVTLTKAAGVITISSTDTDTVYTHPASHAPSIITQDANNRFVTDAEKSTWNGKASTSVATTSVNGLMSSADKTKLDGIATGANNYVHPTGDGNLHVPANGTTNNGKFLMAGATAGSLSWGVPIDTNTWRPVQNNLTSTSATDCLSAAQGKILNDKFASYSLTTHTHSYLPLSGGTISGNLTVTGTLTETSDKRLKTNIQPIRDALSKVQKIQGCTFNKKNSLNRQTGVIAQDVKQVLPEAIVTDENGYLSVAYGNLVGLLIESIKELTARVEELEKEMIEVARFVSLSKSPFDGDMFDAMAGGASFMQTFAGDSMYNPLLLPMANPQSILKTQAIGTVAQMMGLQEDFVTYALLPLQIQDALNDSEYRVVVMYVADGVVKIINAKYGDGGRNGSLGIDAQGNLTGTMNLGALAAEMNKDSALENAAEAFGMNAFGPLGAAIAGAVVGGLMGGGFNLGENVAEAVSNTGMNLASNGITAGLGLTGVTGVVSGMVIGAALKEAMEVAMGLDRSFGFGGELDTSATGVVADRYAPSLTISEAIDKALNQNSTLNTNFTTDINGYINSVTTTNSEGRMTTHDLSGVHYGIDVANQNVQTSVNTSLTDSYFSGGISSNTGGRTGSGESSGLGIGNNRGGAGGFGSAGEAAAGGHTGGW